MDYSIWSFSIDSRIASVGCVQYLNEMDLPASSWRKRFDYKQFQFVSIVTEKHIIGVAIADIRYLASGFCYVFDTETHELVEQQWLKPLNMGYQTQPSSWNSQAYLANDVIQSRLNMDFGTYSSQQTLFKLI